MPLAARHWIRSGGGRLSVFYSLLLGGILVPDAAGQTVEFRPGSRGDPTADEAVRKVLARGRYQVFTRDTVLATGDVVNGDLVVLRSALRVEGTVQGDIVAAQADVFARPGGRIGGVVVVLNGGFYGSSLADVGRKPISAAALDYRVHREEGDRYIISAPGGSADLRLAGLYGFVMPTYDRVNALTISWGLELDRGRSLFVPDASARVRLRSARELIDGVIELTWPRGRHAAIVAGGRTVRTNDRWIVGDLENTLHTLIGSADLRNYYEARFVDFGIRLNHGIGVRWSHELALAWERARTLPNEDPFRLFSSRGGFQENLPVDEGDIGSLKVAQALRIRTWHRTDLDIQLEVELADRDLAGDFTFALFSGAVRADIGTTGAQRVILLGRAQVPASDAPRQRWRALGGWRTLPTLNRLEQVGDRMWFVEATYRLPTSVSLGALGRLEGYGQYAVGNAWTDSAARPRVVHNVGAGLAVGWLALGLYTDPGNDFETFLALGIRRR